MMMVSCTAPCFQGAHFIALYKYITMLELNFYEDQSSVICSGGPISKNVVSVDLWPMVRGSLHVMGDVVALLVDRECQSRDPKTRDLNPARSARNSCDNFSESKMLF